MATEEELPDELDKLEITPVLPQIKLIDSNLPLNLNPFFDSNLKTAETELLASDQKHSQPINKQQHCRRCRFRRSSESVIYELKNLTSHSQESLSLTRTPQGAILKQPLKRTSGSLTAGGPGNRKVILREPVLKALQTCLHPQSNARRKLHGNTGNVSGLNQSSSSNNGTTSLDDGSDAGLACTTRGINDFRDLIDECQHLLSEDVDFSGRLNQKCATQRNSKNFTTMQTTAVHNQRNITRKKILTGPNEGYDDKLLNQLTPTQPALVNSISNTAATSQRNDNHSRCATTSCSQQASCSTVSTAAASSSCDDITINELASYFDTFVHIPKKMSSMAEMMYI